MRKIMRNSMLLHGIMKDAMNEVSRKGGGASFSCYS